jgi:ATP-dependent helicase/nuclease subunit A
VYEYTPPEKASSNDETLETDAQTIDTTLSNTILNQCNFTYQNTKAELPARISVSELVKSESVRLLPSTVDTKANTSKERPFSDLKAPRFTMGDRLTPAERGTTMHTILEHCDFKALREDMHQEVNNLFDRGYLTEEQLKVVDYATIEKLFSSDVYALVSGNNVQRERDFLVRISELDLHHELLEIYRGTSTMLQGCIDAVIDREDSITIIDYKTDNVSDVSTLKERYELQLLLYKSAMALIESKPVTALIYSMKLGETIEI